MFKNLKRTGLIAALALGAMTAATTADARDRYRHRGDDDAALAIGAGIIGLAVGAAIASSGRDRYYYDDYYYGRPRYYRSYPRYYYRYDHHPRHYYNYRYDRRWDRGWDRGRHRGWDRRRYRGGW